MYILRSVVVLKDVAQIRKASVQEMLHFAEVCRVKSVMQPYMEVVHA